MRSDRTKARRIARADHVDSLGKERQREKLPDAPKIHIHCRAQRHMEKRLLRTLWRAWRATASPLSY